MPIIMQTQARHCLIDRVDAYVRFVNPTVNRHMFTRRMVNGETRFASDSNRRTILYF